MRPDDTDIDLPDTAHREPLATMARRFGDGCPRLADAGMAGHRLPG